MRTILISTFVCLCYTISQCQNRKIVNADSIFENFIHSKKYNIEKYLSDTIIVEDVPVNVERKLTKAYFIKHYWKTTVKIYSGTDFVIKNGKLNNTLELFNHCNRHNIEILDDGRIKKFTIEFLYKRDTKLKIPDCK